MGKGLLQRLLCYLKGYLRIRIAGSNAERFFNLCRYQDILLWEICREGAGYTAMVAAKDYFRLRPIIKKTGVRPVIICKKGFPFFLKRNRKRKILFFCALCFAGLLYYLSGFLWRIEYTGCYFHTEEQLRDFLEEQGIFEGVRKKYADCTEIEEWIRSEFTDIGWVSAEIKGTVMKISIQETRMPELSNEVVSDGMGEIWEEEYGHIAAAKDGIVTEITVVRGKAMVRPGDVVKAGDILISGVITVTGDNETIVDRYPVLAEGFVTMKTTENYEDSFSMDYIKKVYTGREKKGIRIETAGRKIFSYTPSNSYRECDIINEMSQYCIGEDFYLPVKAWVTTIREYKEESAVYTEEEARILADEHLLRYLNGKKAMGAVILETRLQTEVSAGRCRTAGILLLSESAWQYRSIIPDEWRLEGGDEHNTDSN